MKATEIYQMETGNIMPDEQIAYHEWHIQYVKWLEDQVVKNVDYKPERFDNEEIIKAFLEIVKPHVHKVKIVHIQQRYDLVYGQQSYDITMFYKKTKTSKETNCSWMLWGNDVQKIRTKEQLLEKIKNNLQDIR